MMRPILFACEKTQKWPALLRYMVANRAPEHRIIRFNRVQHGPLCNGSGDLQLDFALNTSQASQVRWQQHPYHCSVCTSTESTAGRSRTIGDQVSPASAEPYTCPPVVPK